MSFLYPSVFWIGLPLVGLPILIHLLNLRRQRRIQWAAMDFLLESQRRNRTWVFLRQLLLLLTRMAVIAAVVVLLGQLVLRSEWAQLLGRGTTHHVVLLDNSYSMTDNTPERATWDVARQAARQLLEEAQMGAGTRVTLLTFSEAAQLTAGAEPRVFFEPLDDQLSAQLNASLTRLEASQSDVDLAEGLRGVSQLPQATGDPTQILHVISDFRARDFDRATNLAQLVGDLNDQFDHVHLVGCARNQQVNLAVTSLLPESGLRAADVEAWMEVQVANHSDRPARDVAVQLEQDGAAQPAAMISLIPPGETVAHRFRVRLAGTGPHWLHASLDTDAIEVDNHRFFACQLAAAMPILIIDASEDGSDAYYLAMALNPSGPTRTGWQPQIESVDFLRDASKLEPFAAVCLMDVPQLDEAAVESLETYARNGGGVAFFVGATTQRGFCNERLFRDGEGLFPVRLERPTQLLDARDEEGPDLQVAEHPLFRVLAGTRNGLLPLMNVDYYYAATLPPVGRDGDAVQVAATLRNGAPLVVEKRFGKGRVVAQLTRLSPSKTMLGRWSNWSLNPAFPVLASELMGYLARGRRDDPLFQVGDTLAIQVAESDFEPGFRFLLPGSGPQKLELPVDATAADGMLTAELEEVDTSGVYEARLPTREGGTETRLFGVNVATGEGDLALLSPGEIDERLAGTRYEFNYFDESSGPEESLAGFHVRDSMLGLLIVLLLIEQLLACLASYHPLRAAGGNA